MREMVDVNYGKFRIFTFAGAKDKSFEDAGYRLIPFGYAYVCVCVCVCVCIHTYVCVFVFVRVCVCVHV